MSEESEADRRRDGSIYEREQMVPERLLHDLANTPIVDESTLDDTREQRHEGQLNPAEIEIVQYLSHGWTMRMIAEQRGTTWHTVRDQVKSARTALGAKSLAHLVAAALRHGLID